MTTPARTSVVRFNGALSRQVGGSASGDLIDALNAYFLANPNLLLRDATVYARGFDETSYGLSVTLMVQVPGSVSSHLTLTPFGYPYIASYLAGGADTVDAQTSAILALGPSYGKVLPLSSIRPGRQAPTDWILIRSDTALQNPNAVGSPQEPVFAAPAVGGGGIASGASGAVDLWNARGLPLVGTFVARNIGGAMWAEGDRNYAYWDWKFGGLVGMAAGSSATPLTTTTSTGPI